MSVETLAQNVANEMLITIFILIATIIVLIVMMCRLAREMDRLKAKVDILGDLVIRKKNIDE